MASALPRLAQTRTLIDREDRDNDGVKTVAHIALEPEGRVRFCPDTVNLSLAVLRHTFSPFASTNLPSTLMASISRNDIA